jgi:hypothetical protein
MDEKIEAHQRLVLISGTKLTFFPVASLPFPELFMGLPLRFSTGPLTGYSGRVTNTGKPTGQRPSLTVRHRRIAQEPPEIGMKRSSHSAFEWQDFLASRVLVVWDVLSCVGFRLQ